MRHEEIDLFRMLEPPPGGVERFRRRLEVADAAARQVPAPRMLAAGLAAALTVVVLIGLDQVSRGGNSRLEEAGPAVSGGTASTNSRGPANADGVPPSAIAAEFRASPAFARLLGQPLRAGETRVSVGDRQVAVTEIPSTNSKIRIYQIGDN